MLLVALRMMRLYPRPWWGKYAIFSFIIPAALVFHESGASLPISNMIELTALLLMGYSSTFLINSLADTREDRHKTLWRAFTREERRLGILLSIFLVLVSTISAFRVFETPAFIVFLFLQLSSILYSVGPRFKETLAGPVIGSMFCWGPAIMVLLHLRGIELAVSASDISLVFAVYLGLAFFLGLDKELSHDLYDYETDRKAGLKTFGQRLGRERTLMLLRASKVVYFLLIVLLGYMVSLPVLAVALFFVVLGITGQFRVKYFFSVLAIWLLISDRSGPSEILLLLGAAPFISRAVVHLLEKVRAGYFRTRGCYASAVAEAHTSHRKAVFSLLERVK